jgi:hypothetical protein
LNGANQRAHCPRPCLHPRCSALRRAASKPEPAAAVAPRPGLTTPRTATVEKLSIHPAADLLPDPTPAEYERLKEDIRKNAGLRIPVVLTPDGRVLDGRTRVRACVELGISYTTRCATADEMLDPVGFVLALNAARRHLSGDQVIALYLKANAATLEADKNAARLARQTNLKKGRVLPEGILSIRSEEVAEKIAKALGKSAAAVKLVKRVQKVAPERLEDVAQGAASARKILEEVVAPSEQPKAADSYLAETAHLCKRTIAALKRLKDRRSVDPDVLDTAHEALQRVLSAIVDR